MILARQVRPAPTITIIPTTIPLLTPQLMIWSGTKALGILTTGNNIMKVVGMQTKKILFASCVYLCMGLVPGSAMGENMPYTFSANAAAKASEVNENFTYLLERFGTRQTSVNCSNGESITTALQNYNHIVISGVCTENLNLDATTFPHRLVILEGGNSASDGISASDPNDEVIYVKGLITLKMSKLKLAGGSDGVVGSTGSSIMLDNTLIENNTDSGIVLWSASRGWIENSTIQNNGSNAIHAGLSSNANIIGNTISGHSNGASIKVDQTGSASISLNTITNGKSGIAIKGGAAYIIDNNIQGVETGVIVQESGHALLYNNTVNNNSKNGLYVDRNGSATLREGNTFSDNAHHGISLATGGNLHMDCDAQLTIPTTISNNTLGEIYANSGSTAYLCNLSLSSPLNGISAGLGAVINLVNVTITNSQDIAVSLFGAKASIDNSTITGSANVGIRLHKGMLSINNSTVSGNTMGGIESYLQSAVFLGSGVIIENNAAGIISRSSSILQYGALATSHIRNNTNSEINAIMSAVVLYHLAVDGTPGNNEIRLSQGSILTIYTGTSITGTILCDGSLNTGTFITDTAGLNPTTSGC